ncbi:transposase-like protein [Rhodanobacter sp. MP7CTX1]|nr:transposase-like protein [Rhodanobacter sp. MP7CTX1]
MKKRFTEEQIIGFLREAEAGMPVKELCRRHGFSEASYYLWRSKFGGMTQADGFAEREAAKVMINDAVQAAAEGAQVTVGADKGYDAAEFVQALHELKVIPHVAQNTSNRRSAMPDDIAATEGYGLSQRKRKRYVFGRRPIELSRWLPSSCFALRSAAELG